MPEPSGKFGAFAEPVEEIMKFSKSVICAVFTFAICSCQAINQSSSMFGEGKGHVSVTGDKTEGSIAKPKTIDLNATFDCTPIEL